MKTYIIHYSKRPEVRKNLEEYAPFLKDATWMTQYDREDMFCSWIKFFTGSKLTLAYISGYIKHIECLKDMIDNNIEEAFIFEDDVVFQDDWENKFNSCFSLIKNKVDYVKLGCMHELPYVNNKVYLLNNNGGAEAQWVSLKFAKEFLNNINFDQSIDISQGRFLNLQIPCIPVCHQTSMITNDSSSQYQIEEVMGWIEYNNKYNSLKKYSYAYLLDEYQKFLNLKKEAEQSFFKKYKKKIDIKKFDYVYKNDLEKSRNT